MIVSAHIVAGQALGGAELFYVRLVNALQKRRQAVLAINSPGGQVSAQLHADVAQVHVPMRGIWDWPSRWRIGAILREHQPDIVQTYMGRATRLTHLDPGGRPIHVARLGGYYDLKGYRHAYAWVGNTQGICDYLVRHGFPPNRIFHISNFVAPCNPSSKVTLQRLRQEFAIPDDALMITAVGRLHPVKGFDDLLEAFAAMPTRIHERPIYLTIVGDGPLATFLRHHAEYLGISNRVRWPGWRNDAGCFQELADLCVCSSRHEGVGNVILEAWARGRAVLSTRAPELQGVITDREDGWLVPVGDSKALTSAMELLLRDSALRYHLATNGNRTLVIRHSEEAIVNRYLNLYASLLHC